MKRCCLWYSFSSEEFCHRHFEFLAKLLCHYCVYLQSCLWCTRVRFTSVVWCSSERNSKDPKSFAHAGLKPSHGWLANTLGAGWGFLGPSFVSQRRLEGLWRSPKTSASHVTFLTSSDSMSACSEIAYCGSTLLSSTAFWWIFLACRFSFNPAQNQLQVPESLKCHQSHISRINAECVTWNSRNYRKLHAIDSLRWLIIGMFSIDSAQEIRKASHKRPNKLTPASALTPLRSTCAVFPGCIRQDCLRMQAYFSHNELLIHVWSICFRLTSAFIWSTCAPPIRSHSDS